MSAERVVQLRLESRHVAAEGEALSYPGISVVRHYDGHVVERTWLPVGEEPTFSDDEALIAVLQAAWRWCRRVA